MWIFHRNGGMKVCSNGPGHMTKVATMPKMATMPIYVKNMKNSSSLEPKGRWPWKLICSIEYLNTTKIVQIMTYFMARSNFVPYVFVLEDRKTIDFSETIVVYDIKIGRLSQLMSTWSLWVPKVKVIYWPWSKSLRFNIFKLLFFNNQ